MALLVAAYAAYFCLLTTPLAGNLTTHTAAGSHSGDQCQTIWFFWWTKLAAFGSGHDLFWTDMIYHPYGTGLGYHIALTTDLLAVGLSAVTGAAINSPVVFNLMVMFAFVLTGLASFVFIRSVSGSWPAGLIGSLFVTFSPYRFWHLDHLNLLSMGWAIFAIHFAIQFFRGSRPGDLALAVVAMTLSFYTDFFTTAAAVLLIALWTLFELSSIRRRSDRWQIAGMAIAGMIAALLLCYPGLKPLFEWTPAWSVDWTASENFGAAPAELVAPSWSARSVGPGEAYLGWILSGLSLLMVIASRKDRAVRRWGIIALVFLVLSLGPTLRLGDSLILRGLLPYRWLYEVLPIVRLGRTPARFVMAVNIAMAVIVALGVREWLRVTFAGRRTALAKLAPPALIAVVAIGINLEYADTPINLAPMDIPPVYAEVASDTSIHVICELPMIDKLQINNWYMYWQTAHGKPTVNGFLTRHSPGARTLVDQLQAMDSVGSEGVMLLRNARVDAIVWHEPGRDSRLARLGGGTGEVNGSGRLPAPSR